MQYQQGKGCHRTSRLDKSATIRMRFETARLGSSPMEGAENRDQSGIMRNLCKGSVRMSLLIPSTAYDRTKWSDVRGGSKLDLQIVSRARYPRPCRYGPAALVVAEHLRGLTSVSG